MNVGTAPALRRFARVAALCMLPGVLSACDPGPPPPGLDIPPRPAGAPTGSEMAELLAPLGFEAREERIFEEVARGNVPGWLRALRPVVMKAEVDGRTRDVTLWVTPDYLAVGSDEDFFIVPVSPGTAWRIAERVGGTLPTPPMVDAIWAAARVKLVPIRFRPDEHIRTLAYHVRHDRLVQAQAWQHRGRLGDLVAGHKLDVVIAPGGIAPADLGLYGWHHRNGEPIQPMVPVQADAAPHYSNGVRIVHDSVLVDGRPARLPRGGSRRQ